MLAARDRARRRRLQELTNENFKDAKIEIPPIYLKGGYKAGKTVNSRRVLASRKTMANHFDDDAKSTLTYETMVSAPPKYPQVKLCSICGFLGLAKCLNCGAVYCGSVCAKAHDDVYCR